MLTIKNLHAQVEDTPILKGLNLEIGPGEVHAIMGPNGSGKSTLASVLAGREDYEVTAGSVDFDGTDLLALDARRAQLASRNSRCAPVHAARPAEHERSACLIDGRRARPACLDPPGSDQ